MSVELEEALIQNSLVLSPKPLNSWRKTNIYLESAVLLVKQLMRHYFNRVDLSVWLTQNSKLLKFDV
jgi:hypothetical protein